MNKEFILYLKSVKKKKKITNEKLSVMSNVPLGTINKLFSGDTENPKMSTLSAVCKALDVSIEDTNGSAEEDGFNVRMTLKGEEAEFIQTWRKLDSYGKSLVANIINHEISRIADSAKNNSSIHSDFHTSAVITSQMKNQNQKRGRRNIYQVPLYELPVSAGSGVFLEDTTSYKIDVPKGVSYDTVDFALKIRGESMESEYFDGEVILIKKVPSVLKGELGIFNIDGEAFFKVYGGDRLISLNKKYSDILLADKNSARCLGKVVGKL